jgi:hypothetical protein
MAGFVVSHDFARYLGVGVTRWSNVENGRPLSTALAPIISLCVMAGITRDWLYDGNESGLKPEMGEGVA